MEINAAGKSDIGKFRQINEDYFYVDNSTGLFIVCDGLGGHAAGEIASHKAVEFTVEYLHEHWSQVREASQTPIGYFKLTQLIETTIHQTCRRIIQLTESDPELSGMATTLTLLLIVDGHAIVGHVGDSRLYIVRDGKLFQLTTDHTLLNDLQTMDDDQKIEEEQISRFAHVLTRSIGSDANVAVETLIFEARQHDVLLLCTDGLSNYFCDSNAVAEMITGKRVNQVAENLVQFALQRGGKDNITAVVIRIVDVDDFTLNAHRLKLQYVDDKTETDSAANGDH